VVVINRQWSRIFVIAGVAALIVAVGAFDARCLSGDAIEIPKEAVTRKILDNGLTVLASHATPENLVAVDVRIRAGASTEDEYLGSGISHLVEHMVFKGTATRGPGDIEKAVKSLGGIMNGSVSQDITDYRIVLPSKYLPEALAILSDMLLGATFDPGELAREKEVILQEIRLSRDEPQSMLMRLLNETAYITHAYKYPGIGYEEPFRALTRDDALRYFNRVYVPNRIVVTVVGGVDETIAIAAVRDAFKVFRAPDYGVRGVSPPEPPQISPRRADEETPTSLAYLAMGFHSTNLLNDDLYAMDVLSMVLGRGDNSRLTASLRKKWKLVYSISGWNYTPMEPGLFVITAILDKANLGAVEKAVMEEIEKVRTGAIDEAELEGARRMVTADYITALQTLDGHAGDIASSYILTGSYDFSGRYIHGVQAVTRDDIKRVADKYLRPDNLTVARIVPPGYEEAQPRAPRPEPKDEIRKAELPNGLKILVRENRTTPSVSITVAMRGGLMAETAKTSGISSLTADMLLKGTKTRAEDQIKGLVQQLGGDITTFSGFSGFGINMDLLTIDLDKGLDMLKDVLVNSQFPQGEIDKDKTLALASIKEADDDIFQVGMNRLRKDLFEGTPYAFRYLGEPETLESLSRDDIVSHCRNYLIPNNMVIAISGDVDAASVIGRLKAKFSDLRARELPSIAHAAVKPEKTKRAALVMDKEESLVLVGYVTTTVSDPDRYTLDVLSSILSGASGRLFHELRNTMALAYTLGCVQKLGLSTGFFAVYVATTKDKIGITMKALAEEMRKIRQVPVTEEELACAKRELVSARRIAAQTNSFYSMNAALDELYGLGADNVYAYESGIGKVTSRDVKRVAEKYLNPKTSAEVIISSKE